MDGQERRTRLLNQLKNVVIPIKGSTFAKEFDVSRQVIVQDIALLRAVGNQIVSTSEGYLMYLYKEDTCKRVFCVQHEMKEIEDELLTIVDLGGHILNVIVTHPVYGEINVDMMIQTRHSVNEFIKKCQAYNFVPLMQLTDGIHYHTIEAKSEEILDQIEAQLMKKNYIRT